MQLKQLQSEIKEHAQTVYALLPEELTPFLAVVERHQIEKKAEQQEWRQVVMMVEAYARKNEFPSDLLRQLWLARRAMNLHDSLVAEEMMRRTSDAEKKVIGECLRALAHGPFIDNDSELHSVTGLTREELIQIAEAWPNLATAQAKWRDYEFSDFRSLGVYAVGQTLNNLLRYPHHKEHEWSNYISVSQEHIENVERNWRERRKQIIRE